MEKMTKLKIHISDDMFQQIRQLEADDVKVTRFIEEVAKIILPIVTKKHLGYCFCDIPLYESYNAKHEVKFSLTKDNYKRLKIAHSEINTFSMGLIMRWLVNFAIELAKKVGLSKMWRILKIQIKRFIRNKIKISLQVKFTLRGLLPDQTKSKRKNILVPQFLLIYKDLTGKMITQQNEIYNKVDFN